MEPGKLGRQSEHGIGVDAFGGTVIDPTKNVYALVEAANKRQDDLRMAQNELIKEQNRATKELMDVHALHQADIARLRAEHIKELGMMESNRLNAIRQVDVTAVRTEADRSLGAIQTLAAQTTQNAETLRAALVNTATTIAASTSATVSALQERIAALEKSSYEGVGKQRVADPMMAALFDKVNAIHLNSAEKTGKSEGISTSWGILLGAIALLSAIGGFVSFLIMLFRTFKP